MFYQPITQVDYLSSVKITSHFLPENTDPSIGTGFFVVRDTVLFFVTVRHLIGENHKPPADRVGKILDSVSLEYYGINRENGRFSYHHHRNLRADFRECDDENDLAVARVGVALEIPTNRINVFRYEELATDESLSYFPGEPVFLSGYPPIQAYALPNEQAPMPVLRQGIFSMMPSFGCRIPNKLGSDYSYIDTFALGGMSGSPVIAPQIGQPPNNGNPIVFSRYSPRQVVGILAGKVNSREERADEERIASAHSGLSYYVRSQSIIRLINQFQ